MAGRVVSTKRINKRRKRKAMFKVSLLLASRGHVASSNVTFGNDKLFPFIVVHFTYTLVVWFAGTQTMKESVVSFDISVLCCHGIRNFMASLVPSVSWFVCDVHHKS